MAWRIVVGTVQIAYVVMAGLLHLYLVIICIICIIIISGGVGYVAAILTTIIAIATTCAHIVVML